MKDVDVQYVAIQYSLHENVAFQKANLIEVFTLTKGYVHFD
jgi:hypothetical protein